MHLTWLIQGHLTEQDAIQMVQTAETALAYKHVDKDDISKGRLVKLTDRSIYTFERSNEVESNPNSVCEALFIH